MKVLLTGQVGLDKQAYLDKELVPQAKKDKTPVHVFSVGQKLIGLHNRILKADIGDANVLNLPQIHTNFLRAMAMEEIIAEINKEDEKREQAKPQTPEPLYIVNSHAVFRWNHGLFPALSLDLVLKFSPDVVAVLIDDVDQVKRGMKARGTDFFLLWELLAWREEETLFTSFIVDSYHKLAERENGPCDLPRQKTRFYILPKAQGSGLLYRLLSQPEAPRVYLSFPATGIPENVQKQVDSFKKQFSEHFITFDPLKLAERDIYEERGKLPDEEYARKFGFEKRQSDSIAEAIDSQIISRDYSLIDQSDFVLMYIPVIEHEKHKRPLISAGSQTEMVYAYYHGKEVYGICSEGAEFLSPWVTQFSKVFETPEKALEFLAEKYPRKRTE